jgi:sulfate/thiosulfate transport system substrate-binding protein
MKTMKSKLSTGMVLLALPLGVAACGGSSDDSESGDGSGGSIDLVAYSTPQTAYEDSIIPAFQETEEGKDVEFSTSFAASGDQSRAIEAGQPADIAHLALEPDITRIVESGQVAEDYAETEENEGIVQNSVVSFGVRPGNPKDIQDWDDLLRDDVEVLTPNPFTSGGARWNIMAAYGQASDTGKDQDAGLEFVQGMLENTVVQDASARDSLNTFLGGQGDVIISYENEILGAQKAGEELDLVIPDDTIRIDTIAVATEEADETAQAFLDFLFSEDGQRAFAENGYRPYDEKVLAEYSDEFPEVPGLFTIDDLGGWDEISTEFFDPAEGLIADIEADLGVATE